MYSKMLIYKTRIEAWPRWDAPAPRPEGTKQRESSQNTSLSFRPFLVYIYFFVSLVDNLTDQGNHAAGEVLNHTKKS